jgi:hypothetical protein
VHELESFREALGYLDHGRCTIIDTRWYPLAKVDRRARERLRAGFDCSAPVYKADGLQVCRRAGQ